MFVFSSAEIRWFIKGEIPADVFDWFIGLNENYITQPERTDNYLILSKDDSLGIKLREGRIECKQRLKQIGKISPGISVEGMAEKWKKWSFELIESKDEFSGMLSDKEWLPVQKKRILVNYGISEEKIIAQKEPFNYKNGCITEITSVKAKNEQWWTLGLEAYGEVNRLLDNLVLISHLILNDRSNVQLIMKDSMGYPGWIKNLLST